MKSKFYRVIKDNFLWENGAILEFSANLGKEGGYSPINDIWDKNEFISTEYISGRIVENSPDYFERVYPVNLITKTIYKVKEEAMQFINKDYTEAPKE